MSNQGYKRADRVANSIREVLAQALTERVSDPRLRGVLITEVAVSDDIRHARVYFYFLQPDEARIADAETAFGSAARMLRSLVGRELRMKRVPELRFEYDRRVDQVRRIEALLDDVRPDEPDPTE